MKYLILFFVLFTSSLFSQLKLESSISTIFETAKTKKKDVFIKVYNTNCHYCIALKEILSTDTVSAIYNQKFVNYYLNYQEIAESEKTFLNFRNLKISGVPTLLFFNSDGKILYQDNPSPTIESVIKTANDALDPSKSYQFIEKKYFSGDKSISTLYSMSQWVSLLSRDSLLDTIASDLYLAYKKKDSLASRKSFLVLKRCVFDIDNGLYQFWSTNKDSLFLLGLNIGVYEHREALKKIVNRMLDPDKKPLLGLEKIKKLKKEIIDLEISKTPENYLWEEEIKSLLKENQLEEALKLAEYMLKINKYEPSTCGSFIISYLYLFPKGKSYDKITTWTGLLEKNAKTDFDKYMINNIKNTKTTRESEK